MEVMRAMSRHWLMQVPAYHVSMDSLEVAVTMQRLGRDFLDRYS